ncbi:MAG: class I tRNA ligase family protein, partial [Patescibacteria group bacterium]|nr:class I tRNA ligase family protein [Patescibacteria group bacterium]
PNSVLETGHDIIFFWVARMILMSTYALGKSPFKTVYMHGMVCDEKGKKMSKSKGNGVDPLDMTAKYGADALRFSLVTGTTPGNQINVGESKIEGYRNFITKLWNIYRYGTHNLFQDFDLASDDLSGIDPIKRGYILEDLRDYQLDVAEPANAWIILKTDQLIEKVTGGIENYRFGEVGEILYDFAWNELADWYLEASKKSNTQETKATLLYVLETLLKLLHPYIPFVTEMLYKELGGQSEFLMVAPWPQSVFTSQPENIRVERNGQEFELPVEAPSEGVSGSGNQLADQFETMQNIVTKIRSARADAKVNPVKKIDAMIVCKGETLHATSLQNQTDVIKMMANLNTFTVENTDIDAKTKQTSVLVAVSEQITVYLPLAGMVEKEEELARLSKEQANLEKQKASIAGKLGNQGFVANAPEAVITQQQEKLAEIEGLLVSITQQKIQIEQL